MYHSNSLTIIPLAAYAINGVKLDSRHCIRNQIFGVVIQNDLKFNIHIRQKVGKAKWLLGMIKRVLHCAFQSAKTLAYTSLCRPHVEYASSVWDPILEHQIYDIEMIQQIAVRFICNLKGRAIWGSQENRNEWSTLSR